MNLYEGVKVFIGRDNELKNLEKKLSIDKSSLVVVYGRRRIGKTETIRHYIAKNELFCLEFTGIYKVNQKYQINSFLRKIEQAYEVKIENKSEIKNWQDAFELLKQYISQDTSKGKKILFFDEFPWLDSPRSNFLSFFADFYNTFISKERSDCMVVVCGSAASYMIDKFIKNHKMLHGRADLILAMQPFKLLHAKQMIEAKGCRFNLKTITELYMTFGGVAKYLENLDCTLTKNQNIHNQCFAINGLLKNEYEDLYESLFTNAKDHYKVMNLLSSKWSGFTQKELQEKTKINLAILSKVLEQLEVSGFIQSVPLFGNEKRLKIYRAIDCFSYFHNKWIKTEKLKEWDRAPSSQSYKSWQGFAFENICHIHINEIKQRLGISGIETNTHYWRSLGSDGESGAQIDMLIEHKNGSKDIEIVECKFYDEPFKISDGYLKELRNKIEVFNKETNHRHNIRVIFVTNQGVIEDANYNEIVSKQVILQDLYLHLLDN